MKEIFVFGSNLAGIHGAGAARFALEHCGAIAGQGQGLMGNSYGIATKDQVLKTLPLPVVERNIRVFLNDARKIEQLNTDVRFKITQIGCGFAGFTKEEIAPLFRGAPDNCYFDTAWKEILGKEKNYWGSFDEPKRKKITTHA